ncbi:MAG: hypothetical protein ACLU84_01005 [Clostridia bacterium]
MKAKKRIRIVVILLAIILVSVISFVGIFVQDKNQMKNVVPEYQWGMDLAGSRRVELQVNKKNKTVKYDANGKIIDSSDTTTEAANTQEEPINPEENLTLENYKTAKKVIEKRFKQMQVSDYTIRQNEDNGNMIIQIPENEDTDLVISQLQSPGKFTIIDNDTKEVLMTNQDIESVKAGYGTTSTGTTVFVNIQFNKEGKEKFKNITNTYVETKNESEEANGEESSNTSTIKKIQIQIDGETLLTTYFSEEISNGLLQLSVGASSSTTTTSDMQGYLLQAQSMATLLDSGAVPVVYETTQNKFVASAIPTNIRNIAIYIAIALVIIVVCYITIRYKKEGILGALTWVGYIALLLLAVRYGNVMLTVEGLMAIVLSAGIQVYFLHNLFMSCKEIEDRKLAFSKTYRKQLMLWIPLLVIAVVFTFTGWQPIFSFGMTLFWGLMLAVLYQYGITRTVMLDVQK